MPEQAPITVENEVVGYYQGYDELDRLTKGLGLLEFLRLKEIIQRFIEPPPGVVLDVGGGPGRYPCWMAKLGYEVHHIDPVPKHIEQALAASTAQPDHPLASASLGDARSLDVTDASADVVLLMGPLYHLQSRGDRILALREARRVLKTGGVLVATAINRFASLIDGFVSGFIDDPDFISILNGDLTDGRHLPGTTTPDGYFTTAFFHRPEELESEVSETGFRQKALISVQGPGQYAIELAERLSDPDRREQLLSLIRQVETERTLLGMASHFVVIAEK
jgi:ubiquinone/menaquinone biosynthesis C-methylase UbiE